MPRLLTERNLKQHDTMWCKPVPKRAMNSCEGSVVGDWLVSFRANAQSVPVACFVGELLGSSDVGLHVASYARGPAVSEDGLGGTAGSEEAPDGRCVQVRRAMRRPVLIGEGPPGFYEAFVTISTPMHSPLHSSTSSQASW